MSKSMKKRVIRLAVGALLWALPLQRLAGGRPAADYLAVARMAAAYLIIGYDVLYSAVRNLCRGNALDENFLMTLASVGAFIVGETNEAVAVMLFYQVGELFQDYAVGRSRKSVAALMDIRPDEASVITGDTVKTVYAGDVAVGSAILVRPGQRVPLDGQLESADAVLDTSALTGESIPARVTRQGEIYAGTVNLGQAIEIRVTKAYEDSTVSKILDLVENAAAKKSAPERFITRFARWYTPAVVTLAVLLALVPPFFYGGSTFSDWLHRALTFLVVSCPCALVISVPLSFFGGIGGASRAGVLVKGGSALESLSKLHTIVLDKTGTLTRGEFTLCGTHQAQIDPDTLLSIAAHAESASTHPLARSIVCAYQAQGGILEHSRVARAQDITGRGVRAVVDAQDVLCGSASLLEENGVNVPENLPTDAAVVCVARGGAFLGCLLLTDAPKPEARQALAALKAQRVARTVMLTGDMQPAAQRVADALGIDEVYAKLLPQDKVSRVEALEQSLPAGRTLAFVGDGLNDAPVLARADVGIAMGGLGSDAAIEAADVVIMNDALDRLGAAVRLSRFTMTIARENIALALGVKAGVLVLSALGYAGMYAAVFADVGVAVLCILNAMRTLGAASEKNKAPDKKA